MTKTDKATTIIKLLKKGYSPKEITQRVAVSYNYAWKLKRDLEKAAGELKTTTLKVAKDVFPEVGEFIQADTNVDAILNARGSNYGSFEGVAGFAQVMKNLIRDTQDGRGAYLPADQCEALDMIASKIARIVNGNADYVDSWIDIAGYATLVADRLQGKAR